MDKKIACAEKRSQAESEEEVALPGFRFHPTDEELVGFYLRRKVDNKPISKDIIKQIDIYKYDPWDLPKVSTVGDDKEWYFFCLRGRKYRNSIRPNRVTGSGFWKATGIDRPIYSVSDANDCIGLKKSLVYYRGSAGKGTKTDWMMHEFRLPSNSDTNCSPSMQEAEIWTICRIFKRNVSFRKYAHGWKQTAAPKELTPVESCSKTSSFESDAGVEEQKSQMFGGQWIGHEFAQVPVATALMQPALNPNASEFLKDGNWDELGRIMEYYMMEPTASQECRYSY